MDFLLLSRFNVNAVNNRYVYITDVVANRFSDQIKLSSGRVQATYLRLKAAAIIFFSSSNS